MDENRFLNYDGVLKVIQKIGSIFAKQTDLNSHKNDTTSHTSTTDKSHLSSAYTHSQSTHAPSNAQANKIESIDLGGITQAITNKKVSLPPYPTTLPPTAHTHTKSEVGLGNVENKSGATIRSELTKENVVNALGYTPPKTDTNTTYGTATSSVLGLVKSGGDITVGTDGLMTVSHATKSDSATNASAVPWSGITGKPSTFKPESHSHSYSSMVMGNCSNKDFNTIKTTGLYYGYTGMTNAAFDNICVLEVIAYSNDWIVQRQTKINDTGETYERHYHNGNTWSSWKKYFDSKNKPTKSDIGLGNVENKSSATIRGELTKTNVTNALGYTPPTTDTKYTLPVAGSNLGGIRTDYASNGKNYPVKVDADGSAYVNVPWTDNNTVYTHPSHTAKSSGLYKVTVDSLGHVSATTAVTKADITALGIPGSDTNTDTKVTQTAVTPTSYTNWRTLIWGSSNSSSEGFSPTTVTDQVYSADTLSVQPSSGTIRANAFKITDKCSIKYIDEAVCFVFD